METEDNKETIVVSVEALDAMGYLFEHSRRVTELALKAHQLRTSETLKEIPKIDR